MMIFSLRNKAWWLAACLSLPLAAPLVAASDSKHQHVHRTAKPSAGLGLASRNEYQLEAGRAQSITLTLSSGAQKGALAVALSSSDPRLEILSPTTYSFNLADGAPTLTVEVLPHENGRYYLMLNVQLERPGQPAQGQSFGAAIQVGAAPVEAQRLKATSVPEVISLPAQESIRPAN